MNPLAQIGKLFGSGRADRTFETLHDAARAGDVQQVVRLLENRHDVNQIDETGWTPLQIACWENHPRVVAELCKWRPRLEVKDDKGRTALQLAAFRGNEISLRKLLFCGAEVDSPDVYGLTALHKAAVIGSMPVLRLLLDKGADVNRANADGMTALHLAAWKGQREAVKLLVASGARVDARDNDGSTPLHEAVRSGDAATVSTLLERGADPSLFDKKGVRPQELAFATANREAFMLLRQHTPERAEPRPAAAGAAPTDAQQFAAHIRTVQAPTAPTVAEQPTADAATSSKPSGPEQHPRKQFEQFIGNLLFPNRRRDQQPPQQSAPKSAADPYSQAAAASSAVMGGSLFEQKRQDAAADKAAAKPPPTSESEWSRRSEWGDSSIVSAPDSTTQFNLDPYEDETQAHGYRYSHPRPAAPVELPPVTYTAEMLASHTFPDQKAAVEEARKGLAQKVSVQAPPPPVATEGDDDAYDSDDYDEPPTRGKAIAKPRVDAGWGKKDDDEWGAAAKAKTTFGVKDADRVLSPEEVKARLDKMDEMTARAQGWVRESDAKRRLQASRVFAAAYSDTSDARFKASNPLDVLQRIIFGAPARQQEEDQMAATEHVKAAVRAADAMANVGSSKSRVPFVDVTELWNATDGFDGKNLLQTDAFGKVFRATLYGDVVAVRVLEPAPSARAMQDLLQTLNRVTHPNVAALKAECAARACIVTDLPVAGNLLYQLETGVLPNGQALEWRHAVDWALQIASAVAYLARCRPAIAHGSLSLQSVLIEATGTIKISDLGLQQATTGRTDAGKDVYNVGEIMMQLLTRSAYPIDQALCARMQEYARGGKRVTPHPALKWPLQAAATFEDLALRCMQTQSASTLFDDVIPALHELRATPPGASAVPPLFAGTAAPVEAATSAAGARAPAGAPSSWLRTVPHEFLCPITRDLMLDPVALADGFSYERAAAEQWLSSGHTLSPMTNAPLRHPYLSPNHELRRAIQTWLQGVQ